MEVEEGERISIYQIEQVTGELGNKRVL